MVTFGIWPGVVSSDLEHFDTFVDAPPEDVELTTAALQELAGNAARFYVRCYRSYHPDGRPIVPPAPQAPDPYIGEGRFVDLVAAYGSDRVDPAGFADWARAAVREIAELEGGKLQICEEVNAPAPQDGGRPGCYEALAAGLAAAIHERDALGADVLIGFNAAVALPNDPFWATVQSHVDPTLLTRIDYLGLDFFPDVFRPIPQSDIPQAVHYLVRSFRDCASSIGIPSSVPIHITETGWPTGPNHSEQRQAQIIETVAEAVFDVADTVHLDTYEFFGLRDGLTSGPRMNRFGVLRDDHTAKPAFDTFKSLVAAHSR